MKFVQPSQLDTSNPGTWPIYYKALIWIFIVVAAFFLYKKVFFEPAKEVELANDQKIEELNGTYTKLYRYTLELKEYEKRAQELVAILNSLLKYLPLESETAKLIDNVYESALGNNINIDDFIPSAQRVKKEYYDIMPVMLNTTTRYQNFAQFAEKLTHLERIMNISDFSLKIQTKRNSDKNMLSINGQLQTYLYNQDIKALRDSAGQLSDKSAQKK